MSDPIIDIKEAIKELKNNQIICAPTDTVYGLICKASEKNRQKLALLKENHLDKKYTIMVKSNNQALSLWKENKLVKTLVDKYFPGALTIIALEKNSNNFLGIRIPDYNLLLEVIKEVGPIFATSTNKSGRTPLNDVESIQKNFPHIKILKGQCLNQKPSTIVKVVDDNLTLIRKGPITIKL